MSRKGKSFELAYKNLLDSLDKTKYSVTSPKFIKSKIDGKNREVDVVIEYNDAQGLLRKVGIECRDRKSIQDVTWIEQLVTKKDSLEIDCLIATSTSDSFVKSPLAQDP